MVSAHRRRPEMIYRMLRRSLARIADRNAVDPGTARLGALANGSSRNDSDYGPQNMQVTKAAFLTAAQQQKMDDYFRSLRTPPLSTNEIKAGWEIPAVLEQSLNCDLPGDIKALISSNVFDTATGQFVLIPQGCRLVGKYDSRMRTGWRSSSLGQDHLPGCVVSGHQRHGRPGQFRPPLRCRSSL